MEDLLEARLAVLEQRLTFTKSLSKWEAGKSLRGVLENEVWSWVVLDISNEANEQLKEVSKLRNTLNQLPQSDARRIQIIDHIWNEYTRLYDKSEKIFRESLEFLSGLALRDQTTDKICQLTDEIILSCAKQVRAFPAPAIPALQDSLAASLGRLIRLRFPEQTIWGLPYTAHEYGRVVVEDPRNQLPGLVEAGTQILLDQCPYLQEIHQTDPAQAKNHAEKHFFEFFADAFATYIMGPAYVCNVILLRLNPICAWTDEYEHPAETKRVELVLGLLAKMDQNALNQPYNQIICQLRSQWKHTLQRANLDKALPGKDQICIDMLVTLFWEYFQRQFLEEALYPDLEGPQGEQGWAQAQEVSKAWTEELSTTGSVPTGTGPGMSVRTALNAAWLYRLQNPSPASLQIISDVAEQLCWTIVEPIVERRRNSSPTRPQKANVFPR